MSSFRSLLSIFFGLAANFAFGQALPSASAPPAPSASHAHEEPVTLNKFVSTASPFHRNQVDVAQSTGVLDGRALLLKQQATLGATLAAETGISATAFGAGASRPIIRGLGGDRLRLLENGVGTIDASVQSPDHAVSVEPFLVERIEIVRGPASLLYGSSAVGGVVNVITHRIETELPESRLRGGTEVRYDSTNEGFARGGVLDFTVAQTDTTAVVLHVDGFRRGAQDMRIPGFAESARVRTEEDAEAAEHGEPPPVHARDHLPNSSLDAEGGAAGLSLVGKQFHVGFNVSGLDTRYGVPGHAHAHGHESGEEEDDVEDEAHAAGTRIDLQQRRVDAQGEWRFDNSVLEAVRFKVGHADYQHAELEPDGAVGTLFENRGYDARVELLHGGAEGLSGALGFQATRSEFSAAGEEAFLPPSDTRGGALFAFEEIVRGPLTWQIGARWERQTIEALGVGKRQDDELGASVGALWKFDETHTLAISVTHTGRAPNAQELFANGPHAGTQTFEIGDATLDAEKSLGAEISLRRRTGFVTGALTVFANRFDGYIFEEPTGLVAIEHGGEWEFLPVGDEHAAAHGGGLPVFRYVQRDAEFWGAEIETLWHVHEVTDSRVDLRLAGDFTRGRENSRDLPRMPAARVLTGVQWIHGPWTAGVDCHFVFEQDRVAENETASDGYTLLAADVTYRFVTDRLTYDLFARGANLLNEEARPHTSFVKDLAPLPGRGITLGVRMAF